MHPPVYLHLIFLSLQFEISSLMNWIFFSKFEVDCKILVDFPYIPPESQEFSVHFFKLALLLTSFYFTYLISTSYFIFFCRMSPSVKIVSVDMSHRNLEELSLCCSPNFVTHLYLNDNRLCELPKDFFLQFNQLQWLDLRNNLLVNLPTKLPKATASQNA